LAKLPLVGALDVPVCAWLDPAGEGVRCISPPIDAECVNFYDYAVELSLDGRQYLSRSLSFSIFDLRVTGLAPNTGPLVAETEVRIRATGLPRAEIKQLRKVRVDFPKDLRWSSRVINAKYDYVAEEIYFNMPDLSSEVQQRLEEMRVSAAAEESVAAPAGEEEAENEADAAPAEKEPSDPDGGLGGLEVFVELSLNGQNFTEDRVSFTYHPGLVPGEMRLLEKVEGAAVVDAAAKEDPKAKKGGKGPAVEETTETSLTPGSKIACPTRGLSETVYAMLRAEVMTKVGEEDMELLKVVTMPATVEMGDASAGTPDPRGASPTLGEEGAQPSAMLTALVPSVKSEEVPEGAVLYLHNFQASLNGQYFVPCPAGAGAMKLEPLPPEETEEGGEN